MLAHSDEHVYVDARRHGVVLVKPLSRALALAVLGATGFALGWPLSLAGAALLVAAAACRLRAVWSWDRTHVVLTAEKLFVVHGVVRRRAAAVHLARVGAVEVDQSLLGRLLGYGTIVAGDLEIAACRGRASSRARAILAAVALYEHLFARYNGLRMAADELVVHGAREHNLKDITVRLPRNRLICITGLSGSGKSSLAFDTIYAEGQRRYVESLSAYARQFLQMMEKPDVDHIDGLSPAISIDQKTTSRNPRSTVGTVTEIYDYLRLLYARVGRPHCPVCGKPIAGQSIDAIVDQVLRLAEGTRFTVNAPVVRDRKGEYRDLFEEIVREGFTRVKVDGEEFLLDEGMPELDKKFKHTIEVVVDRLVMKADMRARLTQSIETAAALAEGLVAIDVIDGESMLFSQNFACPDHGVSLAELQPRIFSFNAPHGACPRCTGLGSQQEIDPDLVVPDPSLSIDDGALVPWSLGGSSGFYEAVIQAVADRYEIDTSLPWNDLTDEEQNCFLYGTDGEKVYVQYRNRMGRRRQYMLAFDGIVASLERRYRETDSSQQRERIEEYMSLRPCPVCKGARLKPEVLAVTVGATLDQRVLADVGHSRAAVPRRARAHRDRAADRPSHRQGDPRAADVPRRRRRRLPDARPRGGDALGRRGAAAAARDADRLAARRRALHPRRAVDRAAPARQRAADRHARAPARHRQHGRRRRARRGDDAARRLARRHGAGRRAARRRGRRGRAGGEGRAQPQVDHRPVPLAARARSRSRERRDEDRGSFRVRRRRSTT